MPDIIKTSARQTSPEGGAVGLSYDVAGMWEQQTFHTAGI